MGVRYNAEKTIVGKYYTTPIAKFRMKCHLCDNHFEIQTDPKVIQMSAVLLFYGLVTRFCLTKTSSTRNTFLARCIAHIY